MRLDVGKEVIILPRDPETDESVGEDRRFRSEGGDAAKCLSGNEARTVPAEGTGKRGEEELRGPTRDRRAPFKTLSKSAARRGGTPFPGRFRRGNAPFRESAGSSRPLPQDEPVRGPFRCRRCGFEADPPAFRLPHGRDRRHGHPVLPMDRKPLFKELSPKTEQDLLDLIIPRNRKGAGHNRPGGVAVDGEKAGTVRWPE